MSGLSPSSFVYLLCLLLTLLASRAPAEACTHSSFRFESDTFAFANELAWEYQLDPATGRTSMRKRVPKPAYTLRCFVMVRAARQFFDHARFEPAEPKADHANYRHLVRLVLDRSPRRPSSPEKKIVIPGFLNLREFSAHHGELLRAECGPAWQSFVQRGNWRMIFPVSRRQQQQVAGALVARLDNGRPLAVHVFCFPSLTLNHGLLLFDAHEVPQGVEFGAYDPNNPSTQIVLRFDRSTGCFYFPATDYFAGGRVKVYEVYRNLCY